MQIDTNPESARRSLRSSYRSPRDEREGRIPGSDLFDSLNGEAPGKIGKNDFDFVTALAMDSARETDGGRKLPFLPQPSPRDDLNSSKEDKKITLLMERGMLKTK